MFYYDYTTSIVVVRLFSITNANDTFNQSNYRKSKPTSKST